VETGSFTRTASWRKHCAQSKGRRWSATAPLDDALVQVALAQLGLSKPSAEEELVEDNHGLYIEGVQGAKESKAGQLEGLKKKGSWRSRTVNGRRMSSCAIVDEPPQGSAPEAQPESQPQAEPQEGQVPPPFERTSSKGSWRSRRVVGGRRVSSCIIDGPQAADQSQTPQQPEEEVEKPAPVQKKGSWRSKTVNGRRISSVVDPDAAEVLKKQREAKANQDMMFNFFILGAIVAAFIAYYFEPIKATLGF